MLLDNNNKTFQIKNGTVIETEVSPDVVVDIGTLTQLYIGEVSVDSAIYLKKIDASSKVIQDLKHFFKKQISYINEYI